MDRKKILRHLKDCFVIKRNKILNKTAEEAGKELEGFWKQDDHNVERTMPRENSHDVSVIIPVYNTREYVRQCVESVLHFPCRYHIQLLLIDDGSTDGCAEILESYDSVENIDVQVVHQENQGLSGARNTGLSLADGKYIMFLDSDDYLPDRTIEKMMEIAGKELADIICVQYQILKNGKLRNAPRIKKGLYTKYKDMCKVPGYAHMKLFRRSLFDGIWFPENYWFEDSIIHLLVFPRCKNLVVMPINGYVYRINENGITMTRNNKPRSIEAVLVLEKILKNRPKELPDGYMDEVLRTVSKILYNRIKYLPEWVIKDCFLLCCDFIWKIPQQPSDKYKELHKAFLHNNYGIWKWYCARQR